MVEFIYPGCVRGVEELVTVDTGVVIVVIEGYLGGLFPFFSRGAKSKYKLLRAQMDKEKLLD